jgi:hypothetical protein
MPDGAHYRDTGRQLKTNTPGQRARPEHRDINANIPVAASPHRAV